MSAPPYMKFFWGDYFGDTRRLRDNGEHGAYLLLLGEMWRAGGSLANDDDELARVAMCTAKEWARVKPAVLPFFKVQRGRLVHKRISEELKKFASVSRTRKTSGKAGGAASAEKRRRIPLANAEQTPSIGRHNQNQNQNHKEEAAAVDASASGWPERDTARTLAERVASPWLDPAKSPGLITSSGSVLRWRDAGADFERDVVPVVTGLCAGRRSPINSWTYFDGAIGEAVAANRRALEIPDGPEPARRGPTGRQAAFDEKLGDVGRALAASGGGGG